MKRISVFLLAISCLLLSACSLLPPEESIRVAPIIPENDSIVFETTAVERMDLKLYSTVTCYYASQRTENLHFEATGLTFDRYFVELGDRVTAGQLLAQLDMSDIQQRLSQLQLELSMLELEVNALEEDRALALERKKILMEGSSPEDLQQALAEVNKQFDRQGQSLKDEVYLVKLQIQECETEIPQRQLRAGIDGTVHYLYDYSKDPTGGKAARTIRLVDPDKTYFVAETDLWPYLEVGEVFSLWMNTNQYNITVIPAGDLGLPEDERVEGSKVHVYFRADRTVVDAEVGDSSLFGVVLDYRDNALVVPAKAVTTVAGQTVVYYVDENGMRAYKPVETGLEANGMVEILSGLEEGEAIITG